MPTIRAVPIKCRKKMVKKMLKTDSTKKDLKKKCVQNLFGKRTPSNLYHVPEDSPCQQW